MKSPFLKNEKVTLACRKLLCFVSQNSSTPWKQTSKSCSFLPSLLHPTLFLEKCLKKSLIAVRSPCKFWSAGCDFLLLCNSSEHFFSFSCNCFSWPLVLLRAPAYCMAFVLDAFGHLVADSKYSGWQILRRNLGQSVFFVKPNWQFFLVFSSPFPPPQHN